MGDKLQARVDGTRVAYSKDGRIKNGVRSRELGLRSQESGVFW
jgi:hypothetical protein